MNKPASSHSVHKKKQKRKKTYTYACQSVWRDDPECLHIDRGSEMKSKRPEHKGMEADPSAPGLWSLPPYIIYKMASNLSKQLPWELDSVQCTELPQDVGKKACH